MKAQHGISRIASSIGSHKSTISRELRLNAGSRGYRPKRASELAIECSKKTRNTFAVAPWIKEQSSSLLRLKLSPALVASRLQVRQETLYQHVCADKTQSGNLWRNLRCQKHKRKRYSSGRYRRGQIPNCRPINERPAHILGCMQFGHLECDTVIHANPKQAVVMAVERERASAGKAKVSNKIGDQGVQVIIKALTPFEARDKTLPCNSSKQFFGHAWVNTALNSTGYVGIPFANWQFGGNKNLNGVLSQYVPKTRQIKYVTGKETKMFEN